MWVQARSVGEPSRRTRLPLLPGSGRDVTGSSGPKVSPPSSDHAMRRAPGARHCRPTRPSGRATTAFSLAPGPTGAPIVHVSPWSSLRATAACTSRPRRRTKPWRSRPAYGPSVTWTPEPEAANRPDSAAPAGRRVASEERSVRLSRRVRQVRPSSSETARSQWRRVGSASSTPVPDSKNPARSELAWKAKRRPVAWSVRRETSPWPRCPVPPRRRAGGVQVAPPSVERRTTRSTGAGRSSRSGRASTATTRVPRVLTVKPGIRNCRWPTPDSQSTTEVSPGVSSSQTWVMARRSPPRARWRAAAAHSGQPPPRGRPAGRRPRRPRGSRRVRRRCP